MSLKSQFNISSFVLIYINFVFADNVRDRNFSNLYSYFTDNGSKYGFGFICGEKNNINIFDESREIYFHRETFKKSWFDTINFRNCRFSEIKRNYFDQFRNLRVFDIR